MTLEDIEFATDGKVVARRNMALGLWAGRTIGFKGMALNLYVMEVMEADHLIPGPDDIIGKIARDFTVHGIPLAASDIETQLLKQERLTRMEWSATD